MVSAPNRCLLTPLAACGVDRGSLLDLIVCVASRRDGQHERSHGAPGARRMIAGADVPTPGDAERVLACAYDTIPLVFRSGESANRAGAPMKQLTESAHLGPI